jgi:hypothetical protein
MKTKKYRLLELPILSFFSKRLYQDIGLNWKGVNLAYLFLLLAICCIPAALQERENILQALETGQVDILNQIPEVRIQNGEAVVNEPMPYFIKNRDGNSIAIIDTSGSMNYIDDPSVMVMLTENKLVVRRGRNLFNTFNLSGIEDLHIDKHVLNGWLNRIQKSIAPLSYGIFLMLSYIFAVLVMILISVVGLILSNLMNSALSFKDTMRIAITAATPSIIAISIAAALQLHVPGYIYAVITLVYLFVGIKSCSTVDTEADALNVDLKSVLRPNLMDAVDIDEAA